MDQRMTAVRWLRGQLRLFGLRGLYHRALFTISGNEILPVRLGNASISLRLGTTDLAAYEHVFFNKEYDLDLPFVPRTIVDAGANIGLSSVYFALRYPDARILAIESDRSNFEILLRNCAAFEQITPIHAALLDKDGFVNLHDPGEGHWSLQVRESKDGSIRAISIPTLLAENDISSIDLLKMDIEGSEIEVFNTSSSWIDKVTAICAELHDRFRPGCRKAFDNAVSAFPLRWKRGELTCVSYEGQGKLPA